jgi:hypothetical protein
MSKTSYGNTKRGIFEKQGLFDGDIICFLNYKLIDS